MFIWVLVMYMKVLDVYTKDNFDELMYGDMKISVLMNNFFKKFPSSYRKNYDRNLKTLEIHKVDDMFGDMDNAQYLPGPNLLLFKTCGALPHELMHMASSNLRKFMNSICRNGIYSVYENALLEGITEFLATMATGDKAYAYIFECFCVAMLSDINNIFEPYFIPNYNKFISIFPNKRDIYSLMYALDFYHGKMLVIDDDSSLYDVERIRDSVRSVIDSLIDIELSFNNCMRMRKMYGDKFMDLIADPDIDCLVGDVYPEYMDYAYIEVKKRILRRR